MNTKLWGCAHNEERSNFSTARQTCAGELHYRVREYGESTIRYYICTKHEADERAEQEFYRQLGEQMECGA